MAKGKKKDEAVIEEPQVNVENLAGTDMGSNGAFVGELGEEGKTDTEINEQPAEEINEAPVEDTEETPAEETPTEEETPEEPTDETKQEEATEDKGEELIEKAEDLLNGKEEIEDAIKNNDADTAKELLQTELDKAEDIKAEIEEDIKKREANIKKKGLDTKKLFSRRFGGFWNGVSSGWED